MFNNNETKVKVDKQLLDNVLKRINCSDPSFAINFLMHNYLEASKEKTPVIPVPTFKGNNLPIQGDTKKPIHSGNYYKVEKNLQNWLSKSSKYKIIISTYFECKKDSDVINKTVLEERCNAKNIKNFPMYISQLSNSTGTQGQIFEKDRYKNLYILDEVKELVEDFYNKISNENAINYEPTNTNLGDEISIKNDMNKETAIKMFNKQGFDISNYCTFASINNTGACYWANPSYDVLKNDWTFILNDQHKKVLTLLHIPANTFNNNDFIVKKSHGYDPRPNITIMPNNLTCRDGNKVNFARFVKKTINY